MREGGNEGERGSESGREGGRKGKKEIWENEIFGKRIEFMIHNKIPGNNFLTPDLPPNPAKINQK